MAKKTGSSAPDAQLMTIQELAVYLHQQHPRTFQGEQPARQAPEPDSLGG